ncbi:hypothetical protein Tsubulata_026449 [Turnera subulata]|uniref:Protein artemis n=1 Tax=Turnera subulata TaxID=218843 RepID=A0A9Q0JEG0_9ROSI|nr:hypothetical protein Tsubulata_026449 [Turnera subulata]
MEESASGALISVDKFAGGSQFYFLTHLHSDHTQGLTSAWSRGPLYCSKLTAKLLPPKFPDFNLSLLRVLSPGVWHSLPSSSSLHVMLLDAHHCPGAVMFLFRGEFGCWLYTGDFRWESECERAITGRKMLLEAIKEHPVTMLYLDNTYCNPSYDFPSRDFAARQIVDIITSHPEHDVIIGIDTLGKEDLLLYIARVLNIKIWVWPERLQTMHLLGYHDIFTTKTTQTRVRAVPRYSFSVETLEALNTMKPTIGIMPSGLPWVMRPVSGDDNLFGSFLTSHYRRKKLSEDGGTGMGKLSGNVGCVERFHQYIFSVQYSDHSCFSEIQDFVELVKPTNLKGIVSSSSCYVDPLYYLGRLCGIHQVSERLNYKGGRRVWRKRVAIRTKSRLQNGNLTMKRRTLRVSYCGVWASRVGVLRRSRRGAKLVDYDSTD